jgi:hypothetical protein
LVSFRTSSASASTSASRMKRAMIYGLGFFGRYRSSAYALAVGASARPRSRKSKAAPLLVPEAKHSTRCTERSRSPSARGPSSPCIQAGCPTTPNLPCSPARVLSQAAPVVSIPRGRERALGGSPAHLVGDNPTISARDRRSHRLPEHSRSGMPQLQRVAERASFAPVFLGNPDVSLRRAAMKPGPSCAAISESPE